jgi:uncharacterized protein (TIGR01619 family)
MKTKLLLITIIAAIKMNAQNHTEEWDFYFCRVDDKPASIYLDLGLKEVAPVKDKGNIFWVSIQMNNPKEDGLSSSEESDFLWEIEDQLIASINLKHAAVYAGRLTHNGARDYYFYFGDEVLMDKTVSDVMVNFPAYEYDFGIKENDNWDSYFNFLYPSPRDYQSIMNRRVLTQLEKNGDKLTESREVDHWIFFKSDADRKMFEDEVLKRNFRIKVKDFSKEYGENPYKLVITRGDKVGWKDIDKYTIELWELANQFHGDYDGWECPIIIEKKD